ncbi:MAG TPA: tRNA lysidine(34) synthetase TilS [Bacillales bacterium]|nr:tRNA lysidine(34) synthetase TilS [Bacillales bacterium]
MFAIRQAVDRFIKRHQLLRKNASVVVGVSGGPDSMALLDYLRSVRCSWGLTLVVASVDHGFRGAESAEDLRYVEDYCRRRDIAFEGASLGLDNGKGVRVQARAREERYRFFSSIMKKHHADFLALAHHGDDQIETMLMRQVRGSFGLSRAGIPVRRPFSCGEIIRPFLGVDKQQIEKYCEERNIHPRKDPSNESDSYTRNRFRHSVLPFLKRENPNVHTRFQLESEVLTADHLFLQSLAEKALNEVEVDRQKDRIACSVKALTRIPIALQRRVIQLILNYLYEETPASLSLIHIEEALHLLTHEQPSGRLDFPRGLRVVRSYDHFIFSYNDHATEAVAYSEVLDVPGKTRCPVGWITADFIADPGDELEGPERLICDADLVSMPLFVRSKAPGDRIAANGMKGSKKVKAIFIDQKIPRHLREQWPIVTDSRGNVLWVPGLKHSRLAKPSEGTRRYLALRFQLFEHIGEDMGK